MYCPRPPAPIAAAIVADPTPTTAATRTPATIDGSASGNSTCRSSSRGVMPIATPASRIDRSMPVMPTIVERTIGSSAYSTSTVSAARAPTPPMSGTGSRKPNIARLGIVWTMLAIATSGDASPGRRAANTPKWHAERHRHRRRDRDEHDVLADERRQLLLVREPEAG